jgi:putative oxidoreductase
MEISYKYYALELTLRLFCGILFLFQGHDKIFKVRIRGVIETFRYEAQQKHIPEWALRFVAVFTSYVEFIGGILLIIGLFKNYALFLLGIDLVLVAAAFSYMKPMWDLKNVFPRLMLVVLLLGMPTRWAVLSIDYVLRNFLNK